MSWLVNHKRAKSKWADKRKLIGWLVNWRVDYAVHYWTSWSEASCSALFSSISSILFWMFGVRHLACCQSICCHGNGGPFKDPPSLEVNCEEEKTEIICLLICFYLLISLSCRWNISFVESTLLAERGGSAWAVEVDDLPLPVTAVPHSSLLWLGGARRPIGVNVLCDSDVGDAGGLVPD